MCACFGVAGEKVGVFVGVVVMARILDGVVVVVIKGWAVLGELVLLWFGIVV